MKLIIVSKTVINLDYVTAITWNDDGAMVQFSNAPSRNFKGDDAQAIWKACERVAKSKDHPNQ